MNKEDHGLSGGRKIGPLNRPGFTETGVPIHEPLNPDPINKPRRSQLPLKNGTEKHLSKEEFQKLQYDIMALERSLRNLTIQMKDLEDSVDKFNRVAQTEKEF